MSRSHSFQLVYPLGRSYDVGELYAEFFVYYNGLSPCDKAAVNEYLHRLPGELIKLYYRSLPELKQFLYHHPCPSKLYGYGNRNIEHHVDIADGPCVLFSQGVKTGRPCVHFFYRGDPWLLG